MGTARTICRASARGRGFTRVTFGVAVFVSLVTYACLLRNRAESGAENAALAAAASGGLGLKGFNLDSDESQWRLSDCGGRSRTNSEGVRHLMADRRKLEVLGEDGDESIDSISCNTIGEIKDREFLAAGWTKAVYSGRYREHSLAVKVVNTNGHDLTSCLRANENFQICYRKSAGKILKEILLFKQLVHDNMLKVFGYCIPNGDFTGNDGGVVAMVTELGEPLDIIKLLQMSWEDRLRICLGVARLLYYLAHSPLGSLAMNDFRRQQFVLVNGELKLSDVDDISVEEPSCTSGKKKPCEISLLNGNSTTSVECQRGVCKGHNEKLNIVKAGRHFTTFLLPHGAPNQLRPLVDEIVRAYNTVSSDSKSILAATEELVNMYISGKYLKKERQSNTDVRKYRRLDSSDLPGQFDYRCQLSLSGNGCTLSVFDIQEAKDICTRDADCKAFVVTNQTTWTGRKLVHFKSDFTRKPAWNLLTTLYLKDGD